MAGFPHHSLETYLRKLLQAGHRVAICDQVESCSRGPIRREVIRIVTPGATNDTPDEEI
jgi:DNA mismatch repair protein MutS